MAPDVRDLVALSKNLHGGRPSLSDVLQALGSRISEWTANPQFATKTLSELGRNNCLEVASAFSNV